MATAYATTSVHPTSLAISALALEGVNCGFVHKVTGGALYAPVVEEQAIPGQAPTKHLGPVEFEPFEIQIGFTVAKAMFDWVAQAWKGTALAKSGSIQECSEKLEIKAERQFHDALITETTIPTLDAASKDPAWLSVKFAPSYVDYKKASGTAKGPSPKNPEKILPAAGFKLEIDGLDCTKVRKIDALKFRQDLAVVPSGVRRHSELSPGALHFSDLQVTFGEVSTDSWLAWFDEFAVKGNNGQDQEKSGKLTLLSANQQPLATIHLFQLGIHRLGALDAAPGDDRLKLATASLYCGRMEFEHT